MVKKLLMHPGFPIWFFHLPIVPCYLYLSLRRLSLAFFTNTNPAIHTGGFVNDSKTDYIKDIDAKLIPEYLYISQMRSFEAVLSELQRKKMVFPLIFKPNVGERGKGVVKVHNERELARQLEKNPSDVILQEFIDYPLEFGVLYYRLPNTKEEGITSVTLKEIPNIKGDGIHTIKDLIESKYGNLSFENLGKINTGTILEKGEYLPLEYIAHRNRQCVFRNYNHINSPELLATFSKISAQIEGFYFGRYDVKANSVEDLISGNNIKILEINGVGSQPIHIFDPAYSFLKTYSDLTTHWKLIYKISRQNQKRGFHPISFKKLYNEIQLNQETCQKF
ncbi:ATP-grasp domain-containing protein [Flavobacterium humi]|uniref:ATP-grasp domain-containing protein n=1 Tax=Flavobacterium humi TaxID=2562683 RepID=A0A4Z0L8A7_9FLAO|nr:ATP-grasp domain-containing protein [Flavobacterium humi]TGD58024.1 ATP-grasp domain-containing protein [Flavobacterium humi]